MPLDPRVGEVLRLAVTDGVLDPLDHSATRLRAIVGSTPGAALAEIPAGTHFHGIASYVHDALREVPGLPAATRDALRAMREAAAVRHLRTVGDLAHLTETLGSAGVPWMTLKGPALAEPVHGSALRRSYHDLDVLVPARRLREVLAELVAAGSTVTDRNWTLIRAQMKGEVHVQLPSGTHLDLHWHLFNEPTRREWFPVAMTELFDRSRCVTVSGRPVPTLSAADTVVYVALHTLHSGGHRLLWLKDLERLLAQPDADAERIVERACEWQAGLVLTSAIRRVELALGTPPLAAEIRAACPPYRGWAAVTSRAWRRTPAECEDGHGSLGRIVSRSVRGNQRDSIEELGRRTLQNLLSRSDTPPVDRRRADADDPRSDRFPSGGDRERDRFLDLVGASGP